MFSYYLTLTLYFQWAPRHPAAGGQVPGVRPGPPGASEGHYDLHAPDQVHVQQPRLGAAGQQETESELKADEFPKLK